MIMLLTVLNMFEGANLVLSSVASVNVHFMRDSERESGTLNICFEIVSEAV